MDETMIMIQARQQHGLITTDQARRLGMTERAIRTRLTAGSWTRVRRGVFAVGAVPPTWEQQVAAACLAAGGSAVASHRTAARLWGLVERSGRIEVLVDGDRRVRLPQVTVHRSALVDDSDRATVHGVPVTACPRTIVDLASVGGPELMGRWIDQGLRSGDLTIDQMIDACTRLTRPGRGTPLAVMEALAIRSPGHDPGRSTLESRAIEALARRGIAPPVRQHPVRRPDGREAFIDLAYPARLLAIELDGWDSHGLRSAFESDRIRANDLVLLGWQVLRFTWAMSDAYLCDTVERALAA